MIYLSLFAVSFLAATILPFSSELTLAGLIATSDYDNLLLLIVASFGNVLGSVVNWALGSYSRNLTTKKWFPFKETQIERSSKWFRKFGKWSLLFAWVPVVGDPLTLVATKVSGSPTTGTQANNNDHLPNFLNHFDDLSICVSLNGNHFFVVRFLE